MLNLLMLSAMALDAPAPLPDSAQAALPDGVRAVIEQAIAAGEARSVEAVVRFAVAAHPEAEDEIRSMHQAFLAELAARRDEQAEAEKRQLAEASFLERWDGSVELGASRFTGPLDSLGLFGALNARRQGIDWSHRLSARAEIQESDGRRTAERLSAEWQPRLKLDERFYAFGISQLERDPFLGIDARYSAGLGAGFSLTRSDRLKVELEGGAAYRNSQLVSGEERSTVAGRASLDLRWLLGDGLQLKQTGALFVDGDTSSGTATTALDANLFGPLRLRLSYELRFEQDILRQRDTSSTGSRATLVYNF